MSNRPVAEPIELIVQGPNGSRTLRVSDPDKMYFPKLGVTKSQVVRYFLSVEEGILGALRERPTVLERWPSGVLPGVKLSIWQGERGEAFFQKNIPRGAPDWVQTTHVVVPEGRNLDVICPTEIAVVAWAANLGTLTFHSWPVHRGDLDHADQLRIDLDPQAGTDFSDAALVAVELRALLAELGMVGFAKTSGGRGVHVIVPIQPRYTTTEVDRGLVALASELVRRMPRHATMERWKRDRGERVYIDCNSQTVASAYSIRPTARALVSAPVTWDELTAVAPEDFDVRTMPARFAEVGNVHAGLGEQNFGIEPLLEIADRDERGGVSTAR